MKTTNKQKWILVAFCFIILVLPNMVTAKTYESPHNITGFQDLFEWSDSVLNYKFGLGIVIMTFFVSFLLLKAFESGTALIGCLFFTAIVATGCWGIGILQSSYVIAVWVLCAIPAVLILWSST